MSRLLLVTLQGAALLLAFRLTNRRGALFVATFVVVVTSIVFAAFDLVADLDNDDVTGTVLLVGGLLVALAPLAILDAVRHHPQVEMRTVTAALTMYILFGLFFSYLYSALYAFDSDSFTSTTELTTTSFQYLSFITLTTVGYGDITPTTDLARTFTAVEALLGQLYLVTIVGLIVGNLGRARLRPRSDS